VRAFGQLHSAIGQMRAHMTKRCAFGQMPHVLSIGQRIYPNELRIWPNAEIGQMRLASVP